jgi:hypothetical protein
VCGFLALALLGGCGRSGFDLLSQPLDGGAGDGGSEESDGGRVVAADMQFVGPIGATTCISGASGLVAVEEPAAVGQTVIVRISLRSDDESPTSVSDSAGNLYALDVSSIAAGGAPARIDVWSASIGAALGPGDQIAVELPDADSDGVIAEVFDGLAAADRVIAAIGQSGPEPPISATAEVSAPSLLYAASAMANHRSVEQPSGWSATAELQPACGGAVRTSSSHAGIATAPGAGTYLYTADFAPGERWAVGLVAYRLSE